MDNKQAQDLINDVLQHKFNREKFSHLIRNLLNDIEPRDKHYSGAFIPDPYSEHISQYWRVGKYVSPTNDELDILIVEVKSPSKLNTARTTLRNFAINRLKKFEKDYSLIAFYAKDDDGADWRFSFIKQEHAAYLNEQGKVKTKTDTLPARRYSFLVGEHENCYTACKQLLPLLQAGANPTLETIEQAFSIEKVTNEFFQQYKELYIKLSEHLATQPLFITGTEEENRLKVARFAKKLLGQIVFLYFLQKKGWLGVEKNGAWGTGDKHFLSKRFSQISEQNQHYYRDFLQFLFYEALAQQHGADSWYAQFNCKIPFLNGGLFEADYDWKNQSLNIPNALFRNTQTNKAGDSGIGILDVFDRYNFTIKEDEPLEKEVAVDPEMLGKVFENMLDITERKSKGAFYTPREIVHYMCQESLIHYLQDAVPEIEKADTEAFIRHGLAVLEHDKRVVNEGKETKDYSFQTPKSIRLNAEQLDNQLAQLKICDPAIGSGAFPVGLLHEVVNARLLLQLFTPKKHTAYQLKLHCIQQSIYGVDLDASAVDISRLRLWLSLIVDYDEEANEVKTLPNLDYKIMQGNSLVENFNGIKLFNDDYINQGDDSETDINNLKQRQSKIQADYFALHKHNQLTEAKKTQLNDELAAITKLLKTLQYPSTDKSALYDGDMFNLHSEEKRKVAQLYKLHEEFFACTPAKKQAIRQQISELEWELIEATLKERRDTQALEQIKVLKEKNEKPFFLWKLNFPEVFKQQGGFDIVIGNPPYVQIQKFSGQQCQKDWQNQHYQTFQKTGDIYALFIEKGVSLSKQNGVLTFITSNKWMRAGYGKSLRNFLATKTQPLKLIDFGGYQVFDSATVDSNILMTQNNLEKSTLNACTIQKDFKIETSLADYFTAHKQTIQLKSQDAWVISSNTEQQIKAKIEKIGTPLKEWDVNINYGIKTGFNEAFIIDTATKERLCNEDAKSAEIIKPILRGRDIKRYCVEWDGLWIIYSHTEIKEDDYPAIKKHLLPFKEKLLARRGGANPKTGEVPYKWWQLQVDYYSSGTYKNFEKEKIVWGNLALDAQYSFANKGFYINAPCPMITPCNKYILAVLNSPVSDYYIRKLGVTRNGGYFEYKPMFVEQFPVPKLSSDQQQPFINLVDYILFGKEHKLKLQTAYFEQLIDGLVFELYFADEIAAANKPLFKHLGELKPMTDTLTTEEKCTLIQSEFDRLYHPSHPVRNHLETLDSVEEVRIIKEALQ